jgi:hypothetical protein
MSDLLLPRNLFREGVFARDRNKCVNCGNPGQDAHHILERRLWPDGGYYLDNGATVCGPCHMAAEATLVSCDDLRRRAGIARTIIPPHFYPDQDYDKWGNPILPNGQRLRGELFEDESVQKVIAPVLHLFTNRVKYPRTWHLPWSPGATDDDRILATTDHWNGKQVVITEKMDGENTTLYRDYIHARSLDYNPHPSRDRVKALWGSIQSEIPDGYRVCAENLTAVHSIPYDGLPSVLLVFSIWNGLTCLSWAETKEWVSLLSMATGVQLHTVPVLWEGEWSPEAMDEIRTRVWLKAKMSRPAVEGYVVRPADSFHMREFSDAVGKYVRAQHVQTHGHWMRQKLEFNKCLAE